MKAFSFMSLIKILVRLKKRRIFVLMCFVMKMDSLILFMYQIRSFKNCMDLLFITEEGRLHYVYIKDFTGLCAIKQSVKIKKILWILFTVF